MPGVYVGGAKIAAIGLDLKPAIGDDRMGLAWVAVKPGEMATAPNVRSLVGV